MCKSRKKIAVLIFTILIFVSFVATSITSSVSAGFLSSVSAPNAISVVTSFTAGYTLSAKTGEAVVVSGSLSGVTDYIEATPGDIFKLSSIEVSEQDPVNKIAITCYDTSKNFLGYFVNSFEESYKKSFSETFVGRVGTAYSLGINNNTTTKYSKDCTVQLPDDTEDNAIFKNLAYIRVKACVNESKGILASDFYVAYMGKGTVQKQTLNVVNSLQGPATTPMNITDKYVAISFDDTPTGNTSSILSTLSTHNTKATFMLEGWRLNDNMKSIFSQIASSGHEIGNHSTFHQWMKSYSTQEIVADVNYTQNLIKQYSGKDSVLFRAPFIAENANNGEQLAGLTFIDGTGSADTSSSVTAEQSAASQLSQLAPGNIMLLHDNSKTVDTLNILIPELISRGYQCVTISDLFKHYNVTPQKGYSYTNVLKPVKLAGEVTIPTTTTSASGSTTVSSSTTTSSSTTAPTTIITTTNSEPGTQIITGTVVDWSKATNYYVSSNKVKSKTTSGIELGYTISGTASDRTINSWNNNIVNYNGLTFTINAGANHTSAFKLEIGGKSISYSISAGVNTINANFANLGITPSSNTEINYWFGSGGTIDCVIGNIFGFNITYVNTTTATTQPTTAINTQPTSTTTTTGTTSSSTSTTTQFITTATTTPVTSVVYGDVNSDNEVNAKDVLLLRKYIAGWEMSINSINADVNDDSETNAIDVLMIRKYLAGYQLKPWY